MKPAETLNVNITADLCKMRHFGSEMGQKSTALDFLFLLVLFGASLSLQVDSYVLSGSSGNGIYSSLWDNGSEGLTSSPLPAASDWGDLEDPNQSLQQPLEGTDEYEKWQKVLSFDRSYNLSETEKGADNKTRVIVVNEEVHFEIYEDDEEEEENRRLRNKRLRENLFHLLSSENGLSHAKAEKGWGNLQRTKREADGESEKKRCRCRRVWRRTGVRRRQRRRRRRNGQQNQQRRRRQRRVRRRRTRRRRRGRRGRRRCVCRKGDGDQGKSDGDGEESEGGDDGGEGGGDDGGEGGGDDGGEGGGDDGGEGGGDDGGDGGGGEGGGDDGGEGGDEGGGEEGEEGSGEEGDMDGEEGEEDEDSDEGSDEEGGEEEGEGESSDNTEGSQLISPGGGAIPIPPGSMILVPGHPMAPYPNMMPPPNIVPTIGGVPVPHNP